VLRLAAAEARGKGERCGQSATAILRKGAERAPAETGSWEARGGSRETMGLWDKLGRVSDYLGKLRLSLGPDSYFQYKRGRTHERKEADHARERAKDSADRKHEAERGAEREREYDERYARERERDIARERTERTEEIEPGA